MIKRSIAILAIAALVMTSSSAAYAEAEKSLTHGAASLLVPGWGQYINGELDTEAGKIKTGAMILIEVGAIVTTAVVGGVVGYPVIWVGIGLFIFNHVWSATDAFMNAPAGPGVALTEPTETTR